MTRQLSWPPRSLPMLALWAVSCESPIEPTDSDARDTELSDETDIPVEEPVDEPTYSVDIQPIIEDACRGCHTPSFPHGELVLTAGWASLVDRASSQVPSLMRIEPGQPDASYLWHKVSGTHRTVGGRGEAMPAGGRDPLSDARLTTLENWILRGAPQ